MSARFEELDWRETPMGEISLRRRREPSTGEDVYEVKLGDEYLMSSRFTVAEIELARLALGWLPDPGPDVVVGGLGLGYTAQAVLQRSDVSTLVVVEALPAVIDWHRSGLVPVGSSLTSDARCQLVHGDFFAMNAAAGFDPATEDRRFDAVVVDIDHSPRHLLHPGHGSFYDVAGTTRLATRLRPGGVFALWSNDPPDAAYRAVLDRVFPEVAAEVVAFPNPLQGREATNTVYLARTAAR